jgi:hypothetical protein
MADRVRNRTHRWLHALYWSLLLTSCALWCFSTPLSATELSGIIIYACAPTQDPDQCDPAPLSLAWHTAADNSAAPIGVLPSLLPANAIAPPLNPTVDLQYPLSPGNALFTLLWAPGPDGFPLRLGVNLFFNGDTLQPGISAILPTWAGPALTGFHANLSPATYSLFLRDVENPGSLTYSDSANLIELTALMATVPGSVAKIDRMRLDGFGPDGRLDAVGVLELRVQPIGWRHAPAPAVHTPVVPTAPARVLGPLQAQVGEAIEGTPIPAPTLDDGIPAATPVSPSVAPTAETRTPPVAGTSTRTAGQTPAPSTTPAAATGSPAPAASPSTIASPASKTPGR